MAKTANIPIHELDKDELDDRMFDLIELLPKDGPSTTVPHRHDYYELFIFRNGGGTHMIDFQELKIAPKSIHLVAPGQVHHLRRSEKSVGYALMFKESFLRDSQANRQFISMFVYMDKETYSSDFQFVEEEFNDILGMVDSIQKVVLKNQKLGVEMIRHYVGLIILNCREKKRLSMNHQLTNDQMLYNEFRKQVDSQFKSLKKVKEYAQLLKATERSLNEVTKLGCGRSASNVIFERIVVEAKRLLSNTNMTVKEVCYELNFEDLAHFSKFFKNHTGLSPSQFKELYK